MKQITVKRQRAKAIQKGNLWIRMDDILELPQQFSDGEIVQVVDEKHQFLAQAYIGKQHKGLAWVYTTKKGVLLDEVFFTRCCEQAYQVRKTIVASLDTNAYRVFNGAGDGLEGITVDWYNGFASISWYSKGIYHYRQQFIDSFLTVFTDCLGIYEKIRFEKSDEEISSFMWGKQAPEPLIICENGVSYATYMDDGLMTGIFLDQHHTRKLLKETYASQKTVLNLFSYTGAFSVASAVGGAKETISVDVANRSLEKTSEQFRINGIDETTQKIYVMDVFEYIKYATRKQLKFDVIVVDPPSFARTKKRTFSVAKDYQSLIQELIPLVTENGVLVLSTNAATILPKEFDQMIAKAFENCHRNYTVEQRYGLPKDFKTNGAMPETDYLKIRFIRVK